MTPWLIKAMIAAYCIIALSAVIEGRWKWGLYYLGAILITCAVLLMGDD